MDDVRDKTFFTHVMSENDVTPKDWTVYSS